MKWAPVIVAGGTIERHAALLRTLARRRREVAHAVEPGREVGLRERRRRLPRPVVEQRLGLADAPRLSEHAVERLEACGVAREDRARMHRYMQEAAVASPSGMVAIMGADEAAINQLCDQNRGDDVLVPANFNAPGQIVVSGSKAACERVLPAAEAAGFKAVALKVAGAFHSPLMQSAADQMKAELARVTFAAPISTVYSNVTATPHGVASIKDLLVRQIVSPVRWEQTMAPLAAVADARFAELAPGRTLAGLMKRINRRLPIESLATADMLGA